MTRTNPLSNDSARQDDILRASEIGEYVHCGRAWWLGRVVGVENVNREQMEAGTARHREHGAQVRNGILLERLAWLLVAAALIAAGVLTLFVLGVI